MMNMNNISLQELAAPDGVCFGCGCKNTGNPNGWPLILKGRINNEQITFITQQS